MSEPNHFYVILDTRHPQYADTLKAYEVEHRKAWPNNNLSVVLNVDGTQALVKVDAGQARPQWSAAADLKADAKSCVVRTYSRKEHNDVIVLLQTPAWKPVEKEIK